MATDRTKRKGMTGKIYRCYLWLEREEIIKYPMLIIAIIRASLTLKLLILAWSSSSVPLPPPLIQTKETPSKTNIKLSVKGKVSPK
jgi:hypothetical protein